MSVKYKLVYVKWVDSYGCGHAWGEISDISPAPHYCHSVGWIVSESDECIVVVPHLSPAHDEIGAVENGCGDMTIPKVSIINQCEIIGEIKK